MSEFVYLDIDGNEHPRNAWDYHHVFPRCKMKGRGEKDWANLNGLVVPIFKTYHNLGKGALHSQVELPPKPSKDLMYLIRQRLYSEDITNVYDRFIDVSGYIHDLAETTENTGLQRLTSRIADNLERQTPFILQGMVERVEV